VTLQRAPSEKAAACRQCRAVATATSAVGGDVAATTAAAAGRWPSSIWDADAAARGGGGWGVWQMRCGGGRTTTSGPRRRA